MKTLDEVIEAQERCATYPDCHFCYLHSGPMCEWIRDALHYLKEYREEIDNIRTFHDDHIAMKNELAEIKNADNDPLTWDELRLMEGKPVWVEIGDGSKGWVIIRKITDTGIVSGSDGFIGIDTAYGMDTTWQAYRKERE